jgi:DNA polymerase-1|tara:strand:- start:2447 stop:4267 length:1821 start_codon:yes stop_codon:yes gene_type:complete
MKIIYDIETNGLVDTVSNIWIAVTKNIETNEMITFSDYDPNSKPLNELIPYLNKAEVLIGHNIIGYDNVVLHKLLNWKPSNIKFIDTMILSQMNNYKREGKHSLGNFGKILNDAKGDFKEFDKYSEAMKTYAIQDVNLNHKVYNYVVKEAHELILNRPTYKRALQTEHAIAELCSEQVKNKWNFDLLLAKKHYDYLTVEMKKIEDKVNPTLKPRKVFIDKEPKTAKYIRNGNFSSVTCRMLSQFLGQEIQAHEINKWNSNDTFQRYEMIPADLGNMEQVRGMLLDSGWKPTQFTPKGEPKITQDSIHTIQGDLGKQVLHYYSLRSRHSVLKGWIELAQENNGRVYVEAFNVGTPTFRQRHSKIVNVPNVNSFFGKEMRELFKADDGKVMIGCDSAGNQIRALCHYLNNKDITEHVLNGDIHQRTADIVGVDRQLAKSLLYATIFGAGFAKLGKMVNGIEDLEKGREIKNKLYVAFPGLKELNNRLNKFFYTTQNKDGMGFIPALDGRKIYAESSFKLLNYLLQAYEAITVKSAVVNAFKMFKEEKLNVDMLGLIHDEVQVQTKPQNIKRVKEILSYSFGDFITKELELNIQMAGDAKEGNNWYETH